MDDPWHDPWWYQLLTLIGQLIVVALIGVATLVVWVLISIFAPWLVRIAEWVVILG